MNILIINSSTLPYPPVKGGAVENLIDLYVKKYMNNQEYNFTIVSKFEQKALEKSKQDYPNVRFIWINTDTLKYQILRIISSFFRRITHKYIQNAYIYCAKKRIKDFDKYDIVISENVSEYGLTLRSKVKGKLVLHLHNDILNKDTMESKKIFESYDELWCLSKYIKNRVDEIKKDNKTKVLYNGIDIERFNQELEKQEKIEIKEKYNIACDDKIIMYSGRIVPEKGVIELVKAFDELKLEKVKLLIVGDINGKDKYKKKVKKIVDNNENIIATGYVSYDYIPKLYNMADLGVVSSIWEEPFALTVIEFMASNTPLIVTNSGAIPELISKEYAIIVEKEGNVIENIKRAIIERIKKRI